MIKGIESRRENEEEGFTLIELLVVVLILGILMAIAIPTFLSLTGNAKTNAAEADLTTAVQDETVYENQYSDFDGTSGTPSAADNISAAATPPGMLGTDPALKWTTTLPLTGTAGTKTIYVDMVSVNALILGTAGSNGNYYWVYDIKGALSYDFNAVGTAAPTTPAPGAWGTSWSTATNI